MNSIHTPVYLRGYVPLTASGFVESMVEADVCVFWWNYLLIATGATRDF